MASVLDILSERKVTLPRCAMAALPVSLPLYLGKLWRSISEFTASEKTPLLLCTSNNVFQMTSCPTWSFVCSVVRRARVSQFLHTQLASLCAALAKEDVDLDEAVHYFPDEMLFGGKGCSFEMSSVHASMGQGARFDARFKKICNSFKSKKKRKKNMVTEKVPFILNILKLQTWCWTDKPFRKPPFQIRLCKSK